MIIVLLGTQNNSFERLLIEIEKCIKNGIIKEKVIVQSGYTKYSSENMEIIDFMPFEELNKLIQESNLVITHAGAGSINTALKLNKKIIAVARRFQYKEHVNDHQIQIAEEFNKKGYIIGIKDACELEETLKKLNEFIPKEYKTNSNMLLNLVKKYIDNN